MENNMFRAIVVLVLWLLKHTKKIKKKRKINNNFVR